MRIAATSPTPRYISSTPAILHWMRRQMMLRRSLSTFSGALEELRILDNTCQYRGVRSKFRMLVRTAVKMAVDHALSL